MKCLLPIERFLFVSSRTKFLSIILLISLCKTGIWYIPNSNASRLIALDPFFNPFPHPELQYLYWNWFSPFIAWSLGAVRLRSFIAVHFAFALAFTTLFIVTVFRRLPERQARIAFIVFSILPVSGTIYYWIGMDAATLFLILLPLAFPEFWVVSLVAGIALGMQHFEQGFVASGVLLATSFVASRMKITAPYSPRFAALWMASTVLGKIALMVLFAHWGVTVNSGRLLLFGHQFPRLVVESVFHFQVILWSMLGVGWILLLGYADRLGREALPLVVGLLLCSPFLVLALDETRVIAVITFPVIMAYCLSNQRALSLLSDSEAALVFVVWFFVPWSWTWRGIPRWSALPYDVYWIIDRLFGPFPPSWIESMKLF